MLLTNGVVVAPGRSAPGREGTIGAGSPMVLENGRSSPDSVVEVSGLSKSYPYHQKAPGIRGSLGSLFRRRTLQRHAVEGLTFRIARGEVVGFLGPNGAGKTTTLKLLCGLLYPSGGRATVLGHTPFRREHAFLRRIALVMGHKGLLWQDLPAMEMLLAHKEIYDLPERTFRRSLAELAELLSVQDLLHVQVRKLSLGERMKLELLTALVHQPEVLFLDEPTIGLDVVSQQRVRDFLRRLNRELGTTILLTSHYMDDIQELCPRVLVIDQGRMRFDGPLAALVAEAAPDKLVRAVFAEPGATFRAALAAGDYPRRDAGDPLELRLSVPRESVAEVAARILASGAVADLSVEDVPVEEIVRQLFLGQLSESGGAGLPAVKGGEATPEGAPVEEHQG
jgi:ABC-2 type transport system ATP-binding protein